jgi:hypothetical protein
VAERLGHVERRRLAGERPFLDLGRAATGQCWFAAQKLVREQPELEHIGRRRSALAAVLFRRQVRQPRQEARVSGRPRRQPERQEPEVRDLDVALRGAEDIGRTQAEVSEAAPVRETDRARRRRQQRDRRAGRQRTPGPERGVDQLREVDAAHQLGRGEGLAAGHAELVHPRDARVLERTIETGRVCQLRCAVRLCDQDGVKPFDRKLPLEARDAVHLRPEDLSRGPSAQGLGKVVPAEAASCGARTGVIHRHRR